MASRAVCGLTALLVCGGLLRSASATPPSTSIKHPPRSIRYVPERDELINQPSAIAPAYRRSKAYELAFYGNRLTEFRWVGRPGRGGIYEFFAEEAARKKLDVKNYRYRVGGRR
ncbi:MAG: hypothetical protein K2Y37_09540 [Pirellulales bacterium]|nr:hypothetical protein [Pirellulales bacterium]